MSLFGIGIGRSAPAYQSGGVQPSLQTEIAVSAERVANSNPQESAGILAAEIQRLERTYGPGAGARLVAYIAKTEPEVIGTALSNGQAATPDQQGVIAAALGAAYADPSLLNADEKGLLTSVLALATGHAGTLGNIYPDPTLIAQIVAQSGNHQLAVDLTKALMSASAQIPHGYGDQALLGSAVLLAERAASPTEKMALMETLVRGLPDGMDLSEVAQDTELLDRLTTLFNNQLPEFLHQISPDGAIQDPQMADGMVKLFELTLFTGPGGQQRTALMENLIRTLSDAGDALAQSPPISQASYENTHGGWSQQDHVEVLASISAFAMQAAKNAEADINANQQDRERAAKFFIGLAFCLIPGSKEVIGEIAVEGAEFISRVANDAVKYAWSQGTGAMQTGANTVINGYMDRMMDAAALDNIDAAVDSFRETIFAIAAQMPNGENGELNLRTPFHAALAFYRIMTQDS